MIADGQISAAIIGATATVGVGVVVWLLGQVSSYIDYRRKRTDERGAFDERSRAVLHGSFAICNFLAGKLNEWDESKNVADLARITVAQTYISRLIDRSPHENEVLSVSLIDLGLRLEGLLFVVGRALGEETHETVGVIDTVDAAAAELGGAVELLQLLLDPDPAMISEEDLAAIATNPEDIGLAEQDSDDSN